MALLTNDPRFRTIMRHIENLEYADALRHLDVLLPQLTLENRITALLSKIMCLAAIGDVEQARRLVEEALTQIDVHTPLAICLKLQRASLLQVELGPDKVANEMQSLLKDHAEEIKTPDLLWVYIQAKIDLGNCLVLARRYSEGIKELEEALSLQDLPLARYYIYSWLGYAWNQRGDLDKARDHFERALGQAQSAPSSGVSPYYAARLRYELALIAYKQHRFADAAHQLEFASAVGIQDAELLARIEQLKASVGGAKAL